MLFVLTVLAILFGVLGIVRVVQGEVLWGLALILVAFLIGPGGISLFT